MCKLTQYYTLMIYVVHCKAPHNVLIIWYSTEHYINVLIILEQVRVILTTFFYFSFKIQDLCAHEPVAYHNMYGTVYAYISCNSEQLL